MTVKNMAVQEVAAKNLHTRSAVEQDGTRFLRRVLQGNALFSAVSGLLFLLDSRPIAHFMGFQGPAAPGYLLALGIGLLFWALLAFWVSTRPALSRTGVFTIIEGDLLWVAVSIILLLSGWLPFSTAGNWTVAILADIVALFAILQYVGWRRMIKG